MWDETRSIQSKVCLWSKFEERSVKSDLIQGPVSGIRIETLDESLIFRDSGAMKKVAVLTGAGISAESGIPTFRGAGGLWENHRAVDLATPEAWQRDPELVLRFY